MQCSGIHRSLGVHISKVRSATLDTWLPEQVAFIQSMGNAKANSYWEAELPSNYDRVGIENFIRAKYEEKRWAAKDGMPNTSSRFQENKTTQRAEKFGRTSFADENKSFRTHNTKSKIPTTKISFPVPPKGSEPVIRKADTEAPSAEVAKEAAEVKVATDLFDMLSMEDGPAENVSEAPSAADDLWAGFQSVGESSGTETASPPKPVDNKPKSCSEVVALFSNAPTISQHNRSEKPKKDVKSDIMSLFEKGNTTTPYSLHQQQLALLTQQQSLLMAAAAKSGGELPKFSGNGQHPLSGGTNVPNQNWPVACYQIPGMMMPAVGKEEVEKYLQQMRIMGAANSGGNSVQVPTSSTGLNATTNGMPLSGASVPGSTTQNASFNNVSPSKAQSSTQTSPTQSAKDYDFSSLTQGMFSKP